MDKIKLRKLILERRSSLTKHEVKSYSEQIQKRVQPYLQGTIAIYYAFQNEVDVTPFLSMYHCVLPKVIDKTTMQFYEITPLTKFTKNKMGILEPVEASCVNPQDIDVMLIPLVAFDASCNRIGYGGGYYDRYVTLTNALRIGVGFECQKVDEIKPDIFDKKLDMVVTEKMIYKIR